MIRRSTRWRWLAAAVAGALVLLPLALSLAVALPPIAFALPPMALAVALWVLLRRLDRREPPAPPQPERSTRVVPLRRRAPPLDHHRPTRPSA